MTTVSVVIASNRRRALLSACVASVREACIAHPAEIVVARAGNAAETADLRREMPDVRIVDAPRGASVPELRAIALTAATGDVVAHVEDHIVVHPNWLRALLAHAEVADVVGGAIDNAQRARAIDWAAYFAEYGVYAGTRADQSGGARPLFTAASVAYRRAVLPEVVAWARRGAWENVAHDRLLARGHRFVFARDAAAYQNENYSFWKFCADRYAHGHAYARTRLVEEADRPRWLLLAVAPLLPPLLTWRLAGAAGPARRGAFLRALPFTAAFMTAWAIGEAVGYLRGPAPAGTPTSLTPASGT